MKGKKDSIVDSSKPLTKSWDIKSEHDIIFKEIMGDYTYYQLKDFNGLESWISKTKPGVTPTGENGLFLKMI